MISFKYVPTYIKPEASKAKTLVSVFLILIEQNLTYLKFVIV